MMLLSPTNSTALLALYILFSVAAVVASACTQDSDCALGACGRSEALTDSPFVCCASGQASFESFSLRNVCTGLSSGSACNKNNNLCASGICGNDNLCLDEKNAAGESCRDDTMCVSGACGRSEALTDSPFVCCASGQISFESFSLRNVCTGLSSGAACNRNNDLCASGICGNGNVCLDEKNAAGESCQDDNMCVSGSCGRSEALTDSPFVCCASGKSSFESFSLRNVCTGLSSGAACNSNNDLCASGICGDDNLCLDEKLASGESCRDDNMCALGACGRSEALTDSPFECCASGQASFESFSLRNVCTGLSSGSACNKNNNLCASGVCGDDNLCLDEKLAAGEVCRDSNMCALGACGRSEALADSPFECCASGETSWAGSGPGDVCTDLPSGAVCNGNNNICASGICGNIPGSTSVSTCQPNQTAGSNPMSTSGSSSQPNQTATASSNPTSSSGSASQPNQTAGSNPKSTGVYGTQIIIGPDIAQDIKDLLLDDFNGDGRPDLITATGLSPALNFVENEGQGLFGASSAVDSNLSWSATAYKVASGDFDYDGNQDLVVIFTSKLRVYWNNAVKGAEFSTFDEISLDTIFDSASFVDMDVQAADMNEDGYPDIIVTAYQGFDKSTTALLVLQNDGNGGFSDINVLADDVQGFSRIAIGDFDGDGLDDIALNSMKRNMVFVFINNGRGTFERQIVDISASSNKAIAAGDVNDDGYDDLLCQGEDTTTLYVNNRDGTFQEMFQYEVDGRFGPKQRRVQFFDVDGDGLMDLVSMSGEIVWQKQTSSNPLTFSDPSYLNVETAPKEIPGSALSDEKFLATGFAFSDINGDGIEDFIACKYTSPPSVFAFLGEIDTSSSDVSSVSPPNPTAGSNSMSTSGSASQPNQTAGSNPASTSGTASQPNQSAQATISSSTSVAVAYCPTLFFLVQIVIFVAAR